MIVYLLRCLTSAYCFGVVVTYAYSMQKEIQNMPLLCHLQKKVVWISR